MNRSVAYAFAALLLSTTAANAYTFSWDVINPDFYDIVGANSNRSETNTAQSTTLHWGVPTVRNPGQNSGYIFNGLDGSLSINVGETKQFTFAEFTHQNWDITGTSATGAALDSTKLTFGFGLNGLSFAPVFNIDHNETLNNYSNFPACCNDTVKSNTVNLGSFTKDGLKFAVTLSALDMSTREQRDTKVAWKGNVTLLDVAEIPLPPAALLFGTALAGVGFMSKRRNAK